MQIINLKCFHCGAVKTIETNVPLQFAFQLAQWADDIGMYGVIDMARGRSLVFCNKEHAEKEKTKSGHYRMRPKGSNLKLRGGLTAEQEKSDERTSNG